MRLRRIVLTFVIAGIFSLHNAVTCASDFTVAVASSLDKIRQDGANLSQLSFTPRVDIEAARDESESFQLVVIPDGQKLTNVKVNAGALKIAAGNIDLKWYKVGYVKTGNPSYKVDYVGWWPDILMPAGSFDVAAEQIQPLWFTVNVPADATPGVYRGQIVISANGREHTVYVSLHVRNFALPRPGNYAVPMGLYLWAITDWYFGPGQPDEQMPLEKWVQWCEFLSQYRITPKNIGFEYVKRKCGSEPVVVRESENHGYTLALKDSHEPLTVDMSKLQSTVGALAKKYFPPYSYGFYRLPSAPRFSDDWPAKDRLKRDVNSVMAPIKAHFAEWKRQGFDDRVYLYGVDEPPSKAQDKELLKFICDVYREIKKTFPTVKILQVGNCDLPEFIGLVDIYCPKTFDAGNPFFAERLKAGDTVWNYTTWTPLPPAANILVDEDSINYRILAWQSKKQGLTGFLWWSTFWLETFPDKVSSGKPAFPDVPLDMTTDEGYYDRDVRVNWGGTMVYPGKNITPLPSIRLEVFKDGIEDYEYLTLLEKLTVQVAAIPEYQTRKGNEVVYAAKQLCEIPDAIWHSVDHYTHDSRLLFERRRAVGNMIEQLSDIVNASGTNAVTEKPGKQELTGVVKLSRDTNGMVNAIKLISDGKVVCNVTMDAKARELFPLDGKSVVISGMVKYVPGISASNKWIEIQESKTAAP